MDSVASVRKCVTASTAAAAPSLPRAPAPTLGGFVALSRFVVANGMQAEANAAFIAYYEKLSGRTYDLIF